MAIMMAGSGMYIKRGDGAHEYVPPSDVQVNGQDLYLFDQESGTLSISASPDDCVRVALHSQVGPDTPQDVTLPGPMGEPVRFPGVRSVVHIPSPLGKQFILVIGNG